MNSRYVYTCIKNGYYKITRIDDKGNHLPFIIEVGIGHDIETFNNVFEVVTWKGGVDIYFNNENGNFDSISILTNHWVITFEKEDDKNEDDSTSTEDQ